eukprot:jgi/Mesvir1/29407/Mv09315-RA.1
MAASQLVRVVPAVAGLYAGSRVPPRTVPHSRGCRRGPVRPLGLPVFPAALGGQPEMGVVFVVCKFAGGASEIQCVVDRRCNRDDGGASCAGTGYPAPLSRCSPVADGSLSSSPLFTFVDEDAIVDFDFTDEEISRIMRSPDPAETPVASTTGAVDETLSCSIDVGAFWAECEENWENTQTRS